MKTLHLDCRCHSLEHVIRFDLDEERKELWANAYLSNWRPFHRRLLLAFQYLFRIEPAHGHFDCWLMKGEDAARLRELLDTYDRTPEPPPADNPDEDQFV
jgi:hypothetical protein